MKYILNKDKTKMAKLENIELEYIRIPKTELAANYEELKSGLDGLKPEGLDFERDYGFGIRILVNGKENKLGENYGEYELSAGIEQRQINEFMEKLLSEENIILPTQEDFGKIKGDF